MTKNLLLGLLLIQVAAAAQNTPRTRIDAQALALNDKVIAWRRQLHQNPELGNREFKTAEMVATHLKALGLEVQTGVAKTGVVGILKGGQPGPTIALRADMDGLPVTERQPLPFASKVKTNYNGQEVGVMHACGHDTHVAMLMGAAEILAGMKKDLKGTVKFIFQPAEEGPPAGETGGASLMVAEGVLNGVEAIFGIHINAQTEVGTIRYRPEGTMASADILRIKVKGKQSHGAYPWLSVDPVVVSAQIINGLQTVVSRQTELTEAAAVVTIGSIHGGVRNNIIPEEVQLEGTIRALDPEMQRKIHANVRRCATNIAESAGATAEVEIIPMAPVTYNQVALTQRMLPTLERTAGKNNVVLTKAVTGAEDFAFYQEKIPGFYFFVGGMPKGKKPEETGPHHTPDFFIDESGLSLGVRTFCNLVLDYPGTNSK